MSKIDKKNIFKLCKFFQILDLYKISDLTANHASILSADKKSFFTNQHKFFFSQINPSNILKINFFEKNQRKLEKSNIAGFHIHRHLHLSKAEPFAILHTHSVNAVAMSCLKDGFIEKLNQSSMRFYKKVKYVEYNAMAITSDIGKEIASVVDKHTRLIILKNHGNIILGSSLEELQHLTFHFEKCCEIQFKITGMKTDYKKVTHEIASKTSNQHSSGFGSVGKMSWEASIRKLKKN